LEKTLGSAPWFADMVDPRNMSLAEIGYHAEFSCSRSNGMSIRCGPFSQEADPEKFHFNQFSRRAKYGRYRSNGALYVGVPHDMGY